MVVEQRSEKVGKYVPPKTDLTLAADRVLESNYAPAEASVRNVYWENIRKETSEGPKSYYNIYVLLVSPRSELDAATYRVAKMLSESKNPESKAAGEAIVKDFKNVETTPGNLT